MGKKLSFVDAKDLPSLSDEDLRTMVDGQDAFEALLAVRDATFIATIEKYNDKVSAHKNNIVAPPWPYESMTLSSWDE